VLFPTKQLTVVYVYVFEATARANRHESDRSSGMCLENRYITQKVYK
jgi:hypothetical protein